jgi:hypothetical protein
MLGVRRQLQVMFRLGLLGKEQLKKTLDWRNCTRSQKVLKWNDVI